VQGERFGDLDFDLFHREQLPALLAARGVLFTEADRTVLRSLAFELDDGRAYTYVPNGDHFVVVPGAADAHTVARLSLDEWQSFAWELRSCFASLYAEALSIVRGSFGQLVRWEPPLRVAFDGQEIYDVDDPPQVVDDAGHLLDCSRTFSLRDDDREMAEFLRTAGYVHLRSVMTEAETEAVRTVVSVAVADATPDDRHSWWTKVDGQDKCCRVNYLNDRSSLVAGLGADGRFTRIAALGGPELRDASDRLDGNNAVIKVPGASEGLADLPWHRDCGMGGHPVKCPMLNVGIQLDPATPETGQLLVIPGSHRGTSRLPDAQEAKRLPVVALTTEPGDVTVHFGHTLHAAPAPTSHDAEGRRAVYLSFVPPLTFEMVPPGKGYNDVLFNRGAGHIQHAGRLH
jgi:Phytanoyl-CoA dioxygenase (PhyH)